MNANHGAKPKRVLWTPHKSGPYANKFLVGGQDLCLYQWNPEDVSGAPPKYLAKYVPDKSASDKSVRCFDWSPHQEYENIIAVGTSTGSVVLAKIAGHLERQIVGHGSGPSYKTPEGGRSRPVSPSGSAGFVNVRDFASQKGPCRLVAFNPNDKATLLAGFEKTRGEPSLVIYDLEHGRDKGRAEYEMAQSDLASTTSNIADTERSSEYTTSRLDGFPRIRADYASKAVAMESPTSAAWLYGSKSKIIAGYLRWIRAFDTNQPGANSQATQIMTISTKAVYGLAADPFRVERFSSYGEDGIVQIWDMRKSSDPLLSIKTDLKGGALHVSWLHSRSGLLAVAGKDSGSIKVWDIQEGIEKDANTTPSMRAIQAGNGPRDDDASQSLYQLDYGGSRQGIEELKSDDIADYDYIPVIWRTRQVKAKGPILGLTWVDAGRSSEGKNNLIVMTTETSQPEALAVPDLFKIAWSPDNNLALSRGTMVTIHNYADSERIRPTEDISVTMRKRALKGYSMEKNESIVDNELKDMWSWVSGMKRAAASNVVRAKQRSYSFLGVQSVVEDIKAESPDAALLSRSRTSSPTRSGSETQAPLPGQSIRLSELRLLALSISSLESTPSHQIPPFDTQELQSRLESLEANKEYEKAAGLAFFYGSGVHRAVQALDKSSEERLKFAAATLSSYSSMPHQGLMWQTICTTLSKDLQNPYLKAIFAFITYGKWEYVIGPDCKLSLRDRLGIALRYLTDAELFTYIERETQAAIVNGALEGLMLTGLTNKSIDLFESYINKTGDIQTAALVLAHLPQQQPADERVAVWIETYRLLLDRWELYTPRAHFDIDRNAWRRAADASLSENSDSGLPQVFIRCGYCGVSIARNNHPPQRRGEMGFVPSIIMGHQKPKVTICASCRNFLPRCALCHMHLGTAGDSHAGSGPIALGGSAGIVDSKYSDPSRLSTWFTWCQSCRHGGHLGHMSDWFSKHTECPISDCKCQCKNLQL
ncbi:uncharacterized protein BJ171DRAFT_459532 [Polychytrium aggregatum]|uniref:uncharacterized protein n=1 Tax=Polychytrium aggregatum TaxID=110093 RepID=UPI0022FEF798|nr:uncharacterized protein BJ171DRAFT_459532 [Polychytrium aggregatum]KAI9204166.1 hypothetical protein BJ171DRAFT_459532 [Polychytrium aggregatum]